MYKRYRFSNAAKWYEHTPQKVLENENTVELLCTDHSQTGAQQAKHLNY